MAYGDITKSIIDTLTLDAIQGISPSVLHISGNVFAVAYRDGSADGWIKTFECDADGNFTLLNTLEFDADEGRTPHFIHISGTTYAVVYAGSGQDGYLRTLTIQNDGTITGLIDGWEFDGLRGSTPKIINISGTVYAVFYLGWNAGDKFALKTFNIASNGTITKSFIDTLFTAKTIEWTNIVNGNGNYFVLGYRDAIVGDLWIATVEIDTSGNIGAALTDSIQIDGTARDLTIFELATGYVCTAYADSPGTNTGVMKTYSIDSSGNLTFVDSKTFGGPAIYHPLGLTVGGTMRAITFRNAPSQTKGYIQTYDIDDVGNIAAAYQDNWMFDVATQPTLLHVSGDVWMVFYSKYSVLYVSSFLIETPTIERLVTGLFVRGDEIQVVFSPSKMIRSEDFGVTWYEGEGIPSDAADIGFNVFDEEESFIGADGKLYVVNTVSGEIFTYAVGATILGQATRIDVDVDSRIAVIGTDQKLYKSLNLGQSVYLLKDNIDVTDVAIAGTSLVPSGV